MSLELVRNIFSNMSSCNSWELMLLQINTSVRNGTNYFARAISLTPKEEFMNFISEVSAIHSDKNKGLLCKYQNIMNYDGTMLEQTIYKINSKSKLIHEEYDALISSLSNPDHEVDTLSKNFQAYALVGTLYDGNVEISIKMISMRTPITTIKKKNYLFNGNGEFVKAPKHMLSLRTTIDVLIYGEDVYMLGFEGEKLFNMERAYKNICTCKVEEMKSLSLMTDFDAFKSIAVSGYNPRRFGAFNDKRLEHMCVPSKRKIIAKEFGLPLVGDKIDTTKKGVAERLIKLLCNRGMHDPFNNKPVEVAGAKKWE